MVWSQAQSIKTVGQSPSLLLHQCIPVREVQWLHDAGNKKNLLMLDMFRMPHAEASNTKRFFFPKHANNIARPMDMSNLFLILQKLASPVSFVPPTILNDLILLHLSKHVVHLRYSHFKEMFHAGYNPTHRITPIR